MELKDFVDYKRLKISEIEAFLEKEKTLHNYYKADIDDICLNCGETEDFHKMFPDGDNEIQLCFKCERVMVAHNEFMVDVYK